MYKFAAIPLFILYTVFVSACLTTGNNTVLNKKEQRPDEICELRHPDKSAGKYIWLINKRLPLPEVDTDRKENILAEAPVASPEVDKNGLHLPQVPQTSPASVNHTAKPKINKPLVTIKPPKNIIIDKPAVPRPAPVRKSPQPTEDLSAAPGVAADTKPAQYETQVKSEMQPTHKRTVFARRGDDIQIVFNKPGWIFSGFSDDTAEHGLSFVSKDSKAEKTLFTFKADEFGAFGLEFQLQDNSAGKIRKESITVKVVTEDEFSSIMDNSTIANDTEKIVKDLSFANKLYELGQYRNALTEYLKQYQGDDSFLNNRLADIYFLLKDYRRAIHYWKKNINGSDTYKKLAVAGLSKAYMKTDNFNSLVSHMRYLFNNNTVPQEDELLSLAKYFTSRNADKLSLELLNEYMQSYPFGNNVDEIYYLLGSLYEKETDFRNFKKSRYYYQKILSDYPESMYADRARDRVDYLNRHFFYVR